MEGNLEKKKQSVKYHWALTEDGETIHISNVNDTNSGQRFTCPNCGCEMIDSATKSKLKQPHFKHKGGEHCDPESYLHQLAKKRLKEEFDRRNKFLIEVDAINCCDQFNSCLLKRMDKDQNLSHVRSFKEIDCNVNYKKTIDLKQFYDRCDIESAYDGFIADVKLYDSKGEYPIPLFLEIYYSHKCEKPKTESGIPIIEFLIKTEDDLHLLKADVFREISNKQPRKREVHKVVFHNLNGFEDATPYENDRNAHTLNATEYYINQQNHIEGIPKNVICHSLYTGENVSSDAIMLITNSKLVDNRLTKAYVERSFCSLNGLIPLCCEQCKHVTRWTLGKGWLEQEQYSCKNKVEIKEYCFKNHVGINSIRCELFELDEERLNNTVNMAGCVGWVRKDNE